MVECVKAEIKSGFGHSELKKLVIHSSGDASRQLKCMNIKKQKLAQLFCFLAC